MDEFDYTHTSALVSNMRVEAREMDTFPVLLGDEVAHFHRVTGGYNSLGRFDVVNLVHEVQGPGSPYRVNTDELPHQVEAHLSENYYNLSVDAIRAVGDYPDEDYILSMKVNDEMFGPYSFSKPLTDDDIDKRNTRYE